MGLRRNDPFLPQGCHFGTPCLIGDKGNCQKMKAVYLIRCDTCGLAIPNGHKEDIRQPGSVSTHHYIGMTVTTVHNRLLKHAEGHQKKLKGNTLFKHDLEIYGGETQTYTAKVIGTEQKLLDLIMREAIMIEGMNDEVKMNNKNEMGRGSLIRMTAVRGEG